MLEGNVEYNMKCVSKNNMFLKAGSLCILYIIRYCLYLLLHIYVISYFLKTYFSTVFLSLYFSKHTLVNLNHNNQ